MLVTGNQLTNQEMSLSQRVSGPASLGLSHQHLDSDLSTEPQSADNFKIIALGKYQSSISVVKN